MAQLPIPPADADLVLARWAEMRCTCAKRTGRKKKQAPVVCDALSWLVLLVSCFGTVAVQGIQAQALPSAIPS